MLPRMNRSTLTILCAFFAACKVRPSSRPMPNTAIEVDASAAQMSVLRDLLSGAAAWSPTEGVTCLDPIIATYPRRGVRPPAHRWSAAVLGGLLRDSTVRIDSATGHVPPGAATCARSSRLYRLAYGLPRVAADTGSMVVVASRLDNRGNADTAMLDYRLVRKNGRWGVGGWVADSQTAHTYVRGEGCYRLSHAPFPYDIRVDTVLIRAEPVVTGTTWNSFAQHRLAPPASHVGFKGTDNHRQAYWYVSHDSVHFQWGAFNAAVTVNLLVESDALSGVMRWETDHDGPDMPKVPVTGRRVSCPR